MNVDILQDNPDWRWYILLGGVFLILTVLGWLFFKFVQVCHIQQLLPAGLYAKRVTQVEEWIENKVGVRLKSWISNQSQPPLPK
ncbi:hypothetical protein LY78DRAFT_659816 [Colletotrichum sublineola]|nr:hypothetical protein LY78DRAFT_659816 [Colletotrichum sublineola]